MPTRTPSSTHSFDPIESSEPYDPFPLAVSLLRCPSVAPSGGGAMDLLATALGAGGFNCRQIDFENCVRPRMSSAARPCSTPAAAPRTLASSIRTAR